VKITKAQGRACLRALEEGGDISNYPLAFKAMGELGWLHFADGIDACIFANGEVPRKRHRILALCMAATIAGVVE